MESFQAERLSNMQTVINLTSVLCSLALTQSQSLAPSLPLSVSLPRSLSGIPESNNPDTEEGQDHYPGRGKRRAGPQSGIHVKIANTCECNQCIALSLSRSCSLFLSCKRLSTKPICIIFNLEPCCEAHISAHV